MMFFEFTLRSRHRLETVRDLLGDSLGTIRPEPILGWRFPFLLGTGGGGSYPNSFRGEIGIYEFWLIRNLSRRDGCIPVIAKGRLLDEDDGTRIHIRIVPRPILLFFFTLWLSVLFGILWYKLLFSDPATGIPWGVISFLALIIVFGCAVLLGVMAHESALYRMGIRRVLQS